MVAPNLFFLQVAVTLLALLPGSRAQSVSPFLGQGVDPVTAGVHKDGERVPVYLSIVFNKLQRVDGRVGLLLVVVTVLAWTELHCNRAATFPKC